MKTCPIWPIWFFVTRVCASIHECVRAFVRSSVPSCIGAPTRLQQFNSSCWPQGPKSDKDCFIMRCSAKLSQSTSWSLFFVVPKKNQCHPLLIKPPPVLRPSNSSPFLYFLFFSFLGWRAFSAVVCVFYHIQKGADWYLRQTESEINNKKIGGKNMFFCERNVSLPQSNVKEMACFRTPMTLKCQGDIIMTGMLPLPS